MRGLALTLMFGAAAAGADAQIVNTDCSRIGMFANCQSIGPGGIQTTDCSRVGASVSCTTMGNAYGAPSSAGPAVPAPETTAPSTGGDQAAGAAVGAAAVIGLTLLAWKGAQAVHEHRTQDRAKRVALLVAAHDCEGAIALAQKENDAAMAARVPSLCKSKEQAGFEPAYLAEAASPSDLASWAKENIRSVPGSSFLHATRDELDLTQPSAAPAGSMWVREEALSAEGARTLSARSKLMLVAFDCAASRVSIRASTTYAGQNLSGEARSNDHPSEAVMVRPGSIAEAWERRACAAAP